VLIEQVLSDLIAQMVREIAQEGYRHGANAIFCDRSMQVHCRSLLDDVLPSASAESTYGTTLAAVTAHLNTHPNALHSFMSSTHRDIRRALEAAHRTYNTSPMT
jgi:hypothetical protein